MPHFICNGECNGRSETPGLCEADATTCTKAGQPLDPCECEDNLHGKELTPEMETDHAK